MTKEEFITTAAEFFDVNSLKDYEINICHTEEGYTVVHIAPEMLDEYEENIDMKIADLL